MIIAEHPEVCIAVADVAEGPLVTYVHSGRTPPGEVLEDAADEVEARYDMKRMRLLVFTDGGSPSPVARKSQLMRLARNNAQPRTAVVSDQPGVRFVVTTLALFNPNARAFSSREVGQALAFLGVNEGDIPAVTDLLADVDEKTAGRFHALHNMLRVKV